MKLLFLCSGNFVVSSKFVCCHCYSFFVQSFGNEREGKVMSWKEMIKQMN